MLTIADAARVLRAWKGKQRVGVLLDARGERCAIGVLGGEALGIDREGMITGYIFMGKQDAKPTDITTLYGIDPTLHKQIIAWNDGDGLTFSQIADRLDVLQEE